MDYDDGSDDLGTRHGLMKPSIFITPRSESRCVGAVSVPSQISGLRPPPAPRSYEAVKLPFGQLQTHQDAPGQASEATGGASRVLEGVGTHRR